ncbi:hypothetical protein RHGRI_033413 [Rhododendron griersonianum]|uniref:Uncharacterized protein n=1 Tax=Rhododendron griersonianum TaxID=479676 RepID=A0AAV6HX38_9ERIC|nr:hypothetical protein RHGRI_033413 [Rhododendron griersonianum]
MEPISLKITIYRFALTGLIGPVGPSPGLDQKTLFLLDGYELLLVPFVSVRDVFPEPCYDWSRLLFLVIAISFLAALDLVDGRVHAYGLVLQWVPTFCLHSRHDALNTDLCRSDLAIKEKFLIHGFWALDRSGSTLKCTPTTNPLNNPFQPPSVIVEQDLSEEWPNLNGDDESFWEHEYNTHGRCHSETPTSEDYLHRALEALSDAKVDMAVQLKGNLFNDVLVPLGFTAGDWLDPQDLASKMKQWSVGNVKVRCEEELIEAIAMATGEKKDCLCFIEVIVHKDDTSKGLLEWGSRVSSADSRPPNPQ